MASNNMLGWELLEEYKKGRRVFSDIHMEFSDLTSTNLEGVTIKDSKLNFVLLRMSNLKNCRFINCEMFCCGFRDADLTNAIFENCKIDYGYFQNAVFDGTEMKKCNLSFCWLASTNGSTDMSTSTQFKVFTDASQVTQDDMDAAFRGLMPFLDSLDFEIKSQMQNLIKAATGKIGMEPTKSVQTSYGEKGSSYQKPLSVYSLMEQMISSYAAKNPYKTKIPYKKDKDDAYKNS